MSNPPVGREPLEHAHARRLIDAFLVDDLDRSDAARLAAHVKDCPACAAELGGTTRLLTLLGTLPTPPPTPDLDQRILSAALRDRERRHDHRFWLMGLPTQIFRGAVRTTGTLAVTIVAVAVLGGTLVLAAGFVSQVAWAPPRVTLVPDMTPTPAPTLIQAAAPQTHQPVVTAQPTDAPTREPAVAPTDTPELTPAVMAMPSPTHPGPDAQRDRGAHPGPDAQRDRGAHPGPDAQRDRGAHPHAISHPGPDGKAAADSSAFGQPVADPHRGAHRGAVPDIAVATGRAGPVSSFRALRKA